MLILAHMGERPPPPCPTCRRTDEPTNSAPFVPRRSAVLDWVSILEDTVRTLKRAVEEAVL
jgi:hypothetical protein